MDIGSSVSEFANDPELLEAIDVLRAEYVDARSRRLHGSIQVRMSMQDGNTVSIAADRHRGVAFGIKKRIPAGQRLRQQ